MNNKTASYSWTKWMSVVFTMWMLHSASAQMVISEIHYHPVEEAAFNADGTPYLDLSDDVHEFVELQNTGASTVDLSGWTLAGGISYTLPTNTQVAAGGYCVVAKNPARLAAVYGLSSTAVFGAYSGLLGNGSDTIRLRNPAGTVMDAVTYDSRFPWAQSADALGVQDRFTGLSSSNYQYKGRSLQRVSVTWPSGDPANWLASPLTGPTPGAAQAVTRTIPKPVVVSRSAVQASDGAIIIRSNQAVTVACAFSATNGLSNVSVEYFVDDVNATTETRMQVAMTALGNGYYTATLPGQSDRSPVRYRFKANRGEGEEVVSPRSDDPQIAPVGTNGAREAWCGYFVTPVRTSSNAIYDVLVSTAALTQLNANITQSPRRVTIASASGLPRDLPYVAATAPQWNGTQPALFACEGELWDIQIRYHGSLYHRAAANNSFKLHFPKTQPHKEQSAWFVTGHGAEFIEAQKINRLLGLPASKMCMVDWYYNSNAMITRSEQGEYAGEMLDEYHEIMQQLNPGTAKEESGELYKVVGNRDSSQNNNEGPYTRGDAAPMLANASWTQLQRYEWTMTLQVHGWKGSKPVRDLIEGMWTARGDTPATHNFQSNATQLANARAWFTNNWDMETTLTSMALLEWMSIWDDAAQNHFFWRRANGQWSRLGWDYDQVMSTSSGGGGTGGGSSQTIYGGEYGATTVFDGVNWWKDTFYKCFRTEYQKRLWELNNSFFDPTNLAAQGLSKAATFAAARKTYVNTQLSALGTYYKPARPTNLQPAGGAVIVGTTNLLTSAYTHPQATPHAATKWEIRTAGGNYEEPVWQLTSALYKTNLPVPYDQLTYGQTYYWRATHFDTNQHPSIVSVETPFTWGTTNTSAGTLVLNEILAFNRTTVQNGSSYPDYVELRNNSASTLSIAGYALTDNPEIAAKYIFPTGTTIAAGGYLMVWCDDDTNAPGLHMGTALDADGDQLLLVNGAAILDSVTFGPQAPDVAIGRIVNGTGGWQANTPTPGTANSARTLGAVTQLRINEWMADPAYGDDWFELFNLDSNVVALAGLYLSDTPATPAITQIPALSFIEAKGYTRFWADGKDGGNHSNFKLGKSGETLLLTAANGATTLDTITFSSQDKDVAQGRLPDGSNTLISFSSQTASPASPNWMPVAVQLNEVLAHAYPPFEDAIELYNPTANAVGIGGWWLSDDLLLPQKYQIPAGVTVPAGGYTVVYEGSFGAGAIPFAFSAWGDEVVLSAVDANGALTGYGTQAQFGPAPRNQSFGRLPATGLTCSSAGAEYWAQTAHTFGQDNPADEIAFRTGSGATNAAPKIAPVIINEIMYHPQDYTNGTDNTQHEFIELHNICGAATNLAGWKIRGDADYLFPTGSIIEAGGYLLVVAFDPTNTATLAAFRTHYNLAGTTPVYGPYADALANSTHNVELSCPAILDDTQVQYLVDKVEYRDMEPWPTTADGGTDSLQRVSLATIGNTAANWQGAAPTPGAVNNGVVEGLRIVTETPLPGGVVGAAYSNALAASGGSAPYTWRLLAGTVAGLTFSTNGYFTGIPTLAGSNSLAIQVTDSAATPATTSKLFTLIISASALQITTPAALPDGAVGTAYSQALAATGGTPAYAWALSDGCLPGGITLNGAGILSGIPIAPGTFSFTIQVTDAAGLADTQAFAIYVPMPPLTITTVSPLPQGELGTPYSQALTAIGGVPPYAWTNSSGSLPPGLSLSRIGDLAGPPTACGPFSFTAQLTDAASNTITQVLQITVVPPPLRITGEALAEGIVGSYYAQSLAATGGVPPYAWSLQTGFLPEGLSMDTNGLLSGTPSQSGSFPFEVQVEDSLGTSTSVAQTLSITASGPLNGYCWDYVPTMVFAGMPFAVRFSARDSESRVVTAMSAEVPVRAATGAGSLSSPILITELTDGYEDQFELQNVTAAEVDTTGWFVNLGDSLTDINTMNAITFSLPASLPAGGLLRVSELNTSGRTYFGGAINWSSSAGANTKGWLMLFDAEYKLRDFVSIGWTTNQLAALSVDINGEAVTTAGNWSGAPLTPGTRASGGGGLTLDSWQRSGTNDTHTASDWNWCHNTDNSDATSFGATNAGLLLPWSATAPLSIWPTNATLASGVFIGYMTITQAAVHAYLTAQPGMPQASDSTYFTILANVDTDADGMPDQWENAHGLLVGVSDGGQDADEDGANNRDEYYAGTDPQLRTSVLELSWISNAAPELSVVTWPAVAGKLYQMGLSTNLDSGHWQSTGARIFADATVFQTNPVSHNGAPAAFIRIEIAPAP